MLVASLSSSASRLSVSAEVSVERNLGLVSDDESGGTHTSRTIMFRELCCSSQPALPKPTRTVLAEAILQENVLAKKSESTRMRSLRYLREL